MIKEFKGQLMEPVLAGKVLSEESWRKIAT